MGNWRALGSWIRDVPAGDPVDRRNAVTDADLLPRVDRPVPDHLGANAVERFPGACGAFLAQVPATLLSLVATLGAWWLIRRGRIRRAFWLVSGGMVLILSVSLVIRGYHYHQLFMLRTSGIVLAMAALLLGRRALWTCLGAIVICAIIGKLRDRGLLQGVHPGPLEDTPLGMLGSTLLTLTLFGLVMDRFGATLREGFAALLDRQTKLEATARELEAKNQGLAEEITRRQQTESLLVEAQKLKAVGELSSGVAHDFNNLLTGVMGFADLAQRTLPHDSAAYLDIEEIRLAAQKGAELTRQLLTFARRQRHHPRRIQVEPIIRGMSKLLQQLLGCACAAAGTGPRPLDGAHRSAQFEQVLVNLVVNARDATPDRGTVTITTARARRTTRRGSQGTAPRRLRQPRRDRHRHRHGRGDPQPHLRAVLLDQAAGAREPGWGCRCVTASCSRPRAPFWSTAPRTAAAPSRSCCPGWRARRRRTRSRCCPPVRGGRRPSWWWTTISPSGRRRCGCCASWAIRCWRPATPTTPWRCCGATPGPSTWCCPTW